MTSNNETSANDLYGPACGPLLRPAVAAYLGLSISTFYEQIKAGMLPPLVKIGSRASGVPKPWLDAFIAARATEINTPR